MIYSRSGPNNPIDLSNNIPNNITLPLAPTGKGQHSEMEVYARFMRHLRLVPNSAFEIKILSSIQFTADMLDMRDDYVAKIVVDCGLRAPRKAFPARYLHHIDKSFSREAWELGYASKPLFELRNFWLKYDKRNYVMTADIPKVFEYEIALMD